MIIVEIGGIRVSVQGAITNLSVESLCAEKIEAVAIIDFNAPIGTFFEAHGRRSSASGYIGIPGAPDNEGFFEINIPISDLMHLIKHV